MREILFTGKDIKEKWHIGLIAHIGNAWYISNSAGVPTAYEIIPGTIGQYTGIKDKNGVKVFEHFIVKWASQYFAVEWHHTKFVLKKDLRYEMFDYVLACFDGSEFEVVGNIYDNPELLKER